MKMKMTFTRVFGALCVLASCLSCQDQLEPMVQPDNGTSLVKHFTATTESPATKTALSGNDTDGYLVNWQSGDKITIVDGATTPNVGVYETTGTGVKADFTYVPNSGAEAVMAPFTAYYPETLYENGTLTLPATQTYVADNICQSPMYAVSKNQNLSFKNLCGIVRLNISTSQSGQKVKSIALSAGQPMSGTFTVSNDAALIQSGSAGVTLNCGADGIDIGSTSTAFYMAVPAGNYTGLCITVVTTDGGRQTRTANKSIGVERSKITDITLSFNNVSIDGLATDLSATATANTYIVSSPGVYKFKATCKGESGPAIDPAAISGVKVLWELNSRGNAIRYEDDAYQIFYRDGYVYFYTPDTFVAGDANVAIYDSSDNILWSWLIWTTEAPTTVTAGGLEYLDRNLGATATDHGGFCYQWGRKDPFTGGTRNYHNSSNVPYTFVPSLEETFQTYASLADVAYTVAHPTTFVLGESEAHWVTEADYNTHPWSDTEKTSYDPCPAGWKVPSSEDIATGFPTVGNTGYIGSGDITATNYGYYWTSSSDNWSQAWGFYTEQSSLVSCNAQRRGFAIRCVKDNTVKDLSSFTDLSATATANSYIVPAAGDYKFRATVKGNGYADWNGISKTMDAASIFSAELVWATYGTSTAPNFGALLRRIGYKDGYVYFSTGNDGYKEGNAVVTVKAADGTILWSWHLWFTDDSIVSQTYPGGAVFMDRNLGALSATEAPFSYGLLYQWGRKDPFVNTCVNYSSFTNTTTSYHSAVLGTTETGLMISSYDDPTLTRNVEDAVENPTVFYYPYTLFSSRIHTSEWAADMDENLWGEVKTIFDPCPPGWKTPSLSDWNDSFMSLFSNTSPASDPNVYGYTGLTLNSEGTSYYLPYSALKIRPTLRSDSGNNIICYGAGALQKPSEYHFHFWASDGLLVRSKYGTGSWNKNGKYTYSQLSTASQSGSNYPEEFCAGFNVRCVKE
ncbi:MAG: hypothetical protein IJ636_00920 [Bacteroidales bacterium]|nr:hypothetical protein [Bacteroidales bacterium]